MTEQDGSRQVTKRIIRGTGIVANDDVAEYVIDATAAFMGNTVHHYYHGNERIDVEYIIDEAE